MIYLDTSVVVSAFLPDVHSIRVLSWLRSISGPLMVSQWTLTEFSSAAAGQERRRQITRDERAVAERGFDGWLLAIEQAPLLRADFELARDLIRTGQTQVRAPDALHFAVARRLGARLATLDAAMLNDAASVGLALEPI